MNVVQLKLSNDESNERRESRNVVKKNNSKLLDRAIREEVIKELERYKGLIIQMKNKEERETYGVDDLFVILTDNSLENRIRVNQINRALESLDEESRKIIELGYLDTKNHTDTYIYVDLLKLKKKKYYIKKGKALKHIAVCLGMI